jgi:molybdenum cofactor cytidylyltransferase
MNAIKIVSLILSAGKSSRMGKAKALLPWHGKSLLQHAVQAARDSNITDIVAVLGSHADELRAEVTQLSISHTLNANWKLGMGSSIKSGVKFIQEQLPEAEGILIQLADQPRINGESLSKLVAQHQANPGKLIVAEYGGSPGVPALFPKDLFAALLKMPDDAGAKKILFQHSTLLVRVSLPEAAQDIDTPEQYEQLKKL